MEITTADILFRQLEVSLDRIVRVMKLMLIFTLIAGVTITSLLLCMWMRSRKREIAVLSVWEKENGYFYAGFMETAVVLCLSVIGACVIGSGMAGIMKNCSWKKIRQLSYQFLYKQRDIASMFFAGGRIAVIAVCFSLLPMLSANPKDVLSKMEDSK